MKTAGFEELINAPADILGKPITLAHWAGATERCVLNTRDEAHRAAINGWKYYKTEHTDQGVQMGRDCPACKGAGTYCPDCGEGHYECNCNPPFNARHKRCEECDGWGKQLDEEDQRGSDT